MIIIFDKCFKLISSSLSWWKSVSKSTCLIGSVRITIYLRHFATTVDLFSMDCSDRGSNVKVSRLIWKPQLNESLEQYIWFAEDDLVIWFRLQHLMIFYQREKIFNEIVIYVWSLFSSTFYWSRLTLFRIYSQFCPW